MSDFEQIVFIPRSIVRTFQRFFKQIGLKTDAFAIYEFRVSRYIAIASLQCFFFLFICPWVFHFFFQIFLINVIFNYREFTYARVHACIFCHVLETFNLIKTFINFLNQVMPPIKCEHFLFSSSLTGFIVCF